MRIRNARQSEGASRSASVFVHEVHICGHGRHALRRCLGRPGGESRLFEVPICKYALQGSQRPQPTLLVSTNTKWTYTVTADMPIVGISEGPGVNIVYLRSHFAIRNVRQSEAASDSVSVFEHE